MSIFCRLRFPKPSSISVVFSRMGRIVCLALLFLIVCCSGEEPPIVGGLAENVKSKSSSIHPTAEQKVVLQNVMKTLLNFKQLPEKPTSLPSSGMSSKYMRSLFNRYHKGSRFVDHFMQGSIVRSIPAKSESKPNSTDILQFNIHAIKPNEQILRAEVHYNFQSSGPSRHTLRALKAQSERGRLRCFVVLPTFDHSFSRVRTEQFRELPLLDEATTWMSFNAFEAVSKISIQANEAILPPIFGIRFGRSRHNGSIKYLHPRHVLKYGALFLLVFSQEDPRLVDKQKDQQSLLPSVNLFEEVEKLPVDDSVVLPSTAIQPVPWQINSTVPIDHQRRVRIRRHIYDDAAYYAYTVAPSIMVDSDVLMVEPEMNSDLPAAEEQHPSDWLSPLGSFQHKEPAALSNKKNNSSRKKGRKAANRTRMPAKEAATNNNDKHFGDTNDVGQSLGDFIPLPKSYKAKQKQFGGRSNSDKSRKQLAKNTTLPSSWQNQTLLSEEPSFVILKSERHDAKCKKHELIVDFKDIGWDSWIIAPKSFEMHFCAGSCSFPLSKEVNPSNHAMIQAIVHRIGLHPDVPPTCCAPERMDSVSLLYFDEEQNVVLRTYAKMSVKSCGCL